MISNPNQAITLFESTEIRILDHEGEKVIPLSDVAHAIGYHRSVLFRLLQRNREIIGNDAHDVIMVTGDQVSPISHICLTRDGVISLLSKTDYTRIKNEKTKNAIIQFQIWVKKTLGRTMDTLPAIVEERRNKVTEELRDNLQVVKLLNETIGVSLPLGVTLAIKQTEKTTGADLFWCKGLIPSVEEPGRLTPTEIGKMIGIPARDVNNLLIEMRLQTRNLRREYELTREGKKYAEAIPYVADNGHAGYKIVWKNTIVYRLEQRLFRNRQLALIGE